MSKEKTKKVVSRINKGTLRTLHRNARVEQAFKPWVRENVEAILERYSEAESFSGPAMKLLGV